MSEWALAAGNQQVDLDGHCIIGQHRLVVSPAQKVHRAPVGFGNPSFRAVAELDGESPSKAGLVRRRKQRKRCSDPHLSAQRLIVDFRAQRGLRHMTVKRVYA